jgi:hypothetical protein
MLGWLSSRGDVHASLANMANAEPLTVMLAFLLALGSNVVQAVRWWLVLRSWDQRQSAWLLLRIVLSGCFTTLLLPTAAGGDVTRWSLLAMHTGKRTMAAQSIATDRLLGLATLGGLVMFALPAAWPYLPGGDWRWLLLCVMPLTFVAILAALDPRWLPAKIRSRIGAEPVRQPCWLLLATFAAAGNHAVAVAAVVVIGRSLGDTTSVGVYATFVPLIWLLSMLPISIGGLGVRESSFVALFCATGMDASLATAIAGLWLVVLVGQGAIGGLSLVKEVALGNRSGRGERPALSPR